MRPTDEICSFYRFGHCALHLLASTRVPQRRRSDVYRASSVPPQKHRRRWAIPEFGHNVCPFLACELI
jgi:hypothetical protein